MKQKIIILLLFSTILSIAFAQDCSSTSSGLIPIADLGTKTFQGFTGGKYPGGSNNIPLAHFEKGIALAKNIQPLNQQGKVDSINGKIGFMVLGYSTAAMTGRFFRSINEAKNSHAELEIVIGAQGGKDINSMTKSNSNYWLTIDSILLSEHLSAQQIQLIWISSGDIVLYQLPFPDQCIAQEEKYKLMLQNVKNKFPNVQIVFISDRPYAGYIGEAGEGPQELKEPTAYYNAWTVKWLIEKQINNDSGYRSSEIPFIDWGPLLWTDGENGNQSGYTWECDDAGKGGIHASSKGRMKEAAILYLYFSKHPYTKKLFEQ